jgi:hypothetical protein
MPNPYPDGGHDVGPAVAGVTRFHERGVKAARVAELRGTQPPLQVAW